MTSREKVFSSIRSALKPLPESERTPYPEWERDLPVSKAHPAFDSVWELFCFKCLQLHGIPLGSVSELAAFMSERGFTRGYCDPKLIPVLEPHLKGVVLEGNFDRERYDEYEFGITRASGAIAETGSIVLKDRDTASRLGALAPWSHIAIVAPEDVHADMPAAIAAMGDDPNIIWVSGPSRTADVEGILIEGVHGPGVQVCVKMEL